MFQFPRCPSCTYGFSTGCHLITDGGFPHSDTPGSQPAYGSPRHFGVRPVLHRHLTPRHPPCALITLSYAFRCAAIFFVTFCLSLGHVPISYAPSFVPSVPRISCASLAFGCRSTSHCCSCLFAFSPSDRSVGLCLRCVVSD